ncbi:MAG: hypothetical protein ACO3KY_09780 [Lysobacterales bacterium]
MTISRINWLLGALLCAGMQPSFAHFTPGMTFEEIVEQISQSMATGASCRENMSLITAAVAFDNAIAADLVGALAARKDTGCYEDTWATQRLENRILTPESAPVLYTDRTCLGPYAVVRAAVAGFDEVNTDGDEDSRAQTLAPKIVAVLEQAHEAVGDDVPGRRCSEAIAVGVVAGMGQDTAEAGE